MYGAGIDTGRLTEQRPRLLNFANAIIRTIVLPLSTGRTSFHHRSCFVSYWAYSRFGARASTGEIHKRSRVLSFARVPGTSTYPSTKKSLVSSTDSTDKYNQISSERSPCRPFHLEALAEPPIRIYSPIRRVPGDDGRVGRICSILYRHLR